MHTHNTQHVSSRLQPCARRSVVESPWRTAYRYFPVSRWRKGLRDGQLQLLPGWPTAGCRCSACTGVCCHPRCHNSSKAGLGGMTLSRESFPTPSAALNRGHPVKGKKWRACRTLGLLLCCCGPLSTYQMPWLQVYQVTFQPAAEGCKICAGCAKAVQPIGCNRVRRVQRHCLGPDC